MKTIVVAHGDGIGPEIMDATLRIIKASGVELNYETISIGESVYLSGNSSGISSDAWEKIRKHKVILKAPITTPRGEGYKSLNVTLRKALGLYANIRPCKSYSPFVTTNFPELDVVIVRENEEDLYAGIEHQQTDEVVQCLKLISKPGCEKIIHYAFEYARVNNRKKVSCFVKDNIMKLTDGLFNKTFKEIAKKYPEIESDSWIIDIGSARLADNPGLFDVIVCPNLYGDVISDIAAEISGSVGLAGSSNIGISCAMFEAIHGSAPDIAGTNTANPSALIKAACLMLTHLGENEAANKIENAWACTIEEGIHTKDIYDSKVSKQLVGTREFADEVIKRLGKKSSSIIVPESTNQKMNLPVYTPQTPSKKELTGTDIFIHHNDRDANVLASKLSATNNEKFKLEMITNRGVKVWPGGIDETFCTDHWRCRFMAVDKDQIMQKDVPDLMQSILSLGLDVIKTENLYLFDGKPGFSLGQGQ